MDVRFAVRRVLDSCNDTLIVPPTVGGINNIDPRIVAQKRLFFAESCTVEGVADLGWIRVLAAELQYED